MKKLLKYYLLIAVLVLFSSLPMNVAAASGDSTPPVLESMEISPQVIKVGEKLTLKAKITDDFSGVKAADIRFYFDLGHGNRMNTLFLKYNADEQLWIGEYVVTNKDLNGTWRLDSYQLEDNAGNRVYKYRGEITNHLNYFYVIENPTPVDTTPPVIEDIVISPKKVEVGQEVTISVKAKDQSGIERIQSDFEIFQPEKKRLYKDIQYTFNETTGYWTGSYKILPSDRSGTWYYKPIISDPVHNTTFVETNQYSFEVVNPIGGDESPPQIEWLTVSPRKVTVNEKVMLKAKVTDDKVEVGGVHLSLFPPSKNSERMIHLYDRDKDGIWEGEYQISSLDELGKWNVDAIIAYDMANNAKQFFLKDFPNKEELDITIVEDHKSPAPPKVNLVTDHSKHLTGTAEPLSKILVKMDGEEYTTITNKEGIFQLPIPLLPVDMIIQVFATDAAGNQSEASLVKVIDRTVPFDPELNEVTDSSIAVTGIGEPQAKVTISNGKKSYEGKVDTNGEFSVKIPVQKAGTKLSVWLTDAAGNVSKKITLKVVDKTPPTPPVVHPVKSTSTTVTGKTEPLAKVSVSFGNKVIGTATSNNEGRFSVKINKQMKNRTLNVIATDQAKNVSKPQSVKVK
jgi:hypothetical protein